MIDYSNFQPRNDGVLVKVQLRETVGRLAVSQNNPLSHIFTVAAKGPHESCKDIEIGARVWLVGKLREDYDFMPGSKSFLLIGQKNVVGVIPEEILEEHSKVLTR